MHDGRRGGSNRDYLLSPLLRSILHACTTWSEHDACAARARTPNLTVRETRGPFVSCAAKKCQPAASSLIVRASGPPESCTSAAPRPAVVAASVHNKIRRNGGCVCVEGDLHIVGFAYRG